MRIKPGAAKAIVTAAALMVVPIGAVLAVAGSAAIGAFSAAPVFARQSPRYSNALPPYDLSKETKLEGTIRRISTRSDAAKGLPGTHLMLQTAQGALDAHLGSGDAVQPPHMRLVPGQTVELTGMMARYRGNPVLVVRILTTSSHIYVLRNEQGMPVRAVAPRTVPVSQPPLEEGL